jgi:hypothetical protein
MGTLDNINTALTEALHKTVKAAFCHSNRVDFISQMCFWDDRRLSVEMREATLRFLALDDVGHWSCKIHKSFDVPNEVRQARPLLASLKPYTSLLDVEKNLEVPRFQKAMLAYIKILHQQLRQAGRALETDLYTTCLENRNSLSISHASSAALTYLSFHGGGKFKRHLICCTQNWRRKEKRSDYVFFQNEVVGSKKAEDAFGGRAVGHVLCLFEWKAASRVGKQERHSLALIDILLPLKPTVGKYKRGEEEQAYLKHHGMFMVEKPAGLAGRQVVDISCFRRAAHVVPTDVWA